MNRYLSGILCAALLAAVATVVVEQRRIQSIRRQFASEAVQVDWNAARFAIRPANNVMDWFYDQNDPMESAAVQRLRQIYLLADSQAIHSNTRGDTRSSVCPSLRRKVPSSAFGSRKGRLNPAAICFALDRSVDRTATYIN
jgi:hypothetical protein